MNLETLKLELIGWIADLEDEVVLKRLNLLRRKSSGGWESMSYEDRLAIEEGINQLNEGNSTPYSDVRKEIDSILTAEE